MMTSEFEPGLAIVGLGWGLNVQIHAFRARGWKVVAVVGRREDKTREAAAKHNIPLATTSLADVLSRDDISLISVVTPPSSHREIVISCLRAGRNILTEKPFALNVTEARLMRDAYRSAAANNSKLIALVDHELRALSCVKAARTHIGDPNTFGRVQSLALTHVGPLAVSGHFNWWSLRAEAGGILNAVGSHLIDLVQHITQTQIHRVRAHLHTVHKTKTDENGNDKSVETDDYCQLQLLLSSTSNESYPASITIGGSTVGYSQKSLLVSGSKGTIHIDLDKLITTFHSGQRTPDGKQATPQILVNGSDNIEESIPITRNAFCIGTVHLAEQLYTIIKTGDHELLKTFATFDDGLQVQSVIDAALTSHDKDMWVDVK